MAMSTEAFVEVLAKSRLLSAEQLAEARDNTLLTDDAEQLSQILIEQGWITGWQTSQLLAGQTNFFLGNYVLLELLGRGGMGTVYLARHTTMNREVALKIVSKRLGKDPASVERFLSEARASAVLDHPNIVRAYDVGKESDRFYIVMEYVPGHDLDELVELDGPMPVEVAVDCIRQAAEGLAHAHSRNMVHCDIKPSNLLVSDQGVVKILDMGMARLMSDDGTASGTNQTDRPVLGTVDYMAPEQAVRGPKFDHRADIYSLGCTLYFLLTGRPPFDGGSLTQRILKHQTLPPPDVREVRPDVPADLAEICMRMMAKDPDARYQTVREVAERLAAWEPTETPAPAEDVPDEPAAAPEGSVDLAAVPVAPPPRNGPPALSPTVWVALVIGLIAIVLLGAAVTVIVLRARTAQFVRTNELTAPARPPQKPVPTLPVPVGPLAPAGRPSESADNVPEGPSPTPAGPPILPPSPVQPLTPQPLPPQPEPPQPEPEPAQPEPALDPGASGSIIQPGGAAGVVAVPGESGTGGFEIQPPGPTKGEITPPSSQPSGGEPADPFGELARAVDLPAAPKATAANPPRSHTLGRLVVPKSEACQIELVGGTTAMPGDQEFLFARSDELDTWPILYRAPNGTIESVATVRLVKGALRFQWNPLRDVPAASLRYTALRVQVGARSAVMQLGKPLAVEPLVLLPALGAGTARVPLDPPPDSEALRLTIIGVEGFPGRPTFDPSETVSPGGMTTLVFTPPGAPQVLLQVEHVLRRGEARIEAAAYYQMPQQVVRKRLNAATFNELINESKRLTALEKSLAARLKHVGGSSGHQVELLKSQLSNVRQRRKHVSGVEELQAAIQQQIRIHFRLYLDAGGQDIEVANTQSR